MIERRERFAVAVDGKKISAILATPPEGWDRAAGLVVLAHGAGNDMDHPLLVALTEGLAAAGYLTVRFNFPYREAGRKTPDPAPRLESTWLAMADFLDARLEGRRLPRVVGGKSLGGRIAAQLVSDGVLEANALVFLGYPLHRAGDEHRLRDVPLKGITVPMLFHTGSKDRLCRVDLLTAVTRGLRGPATLNVIEGGDHSLDLLHGEPADRERIRAEVVDRTRVWLRKSLKRSGRRR